MNRYALLNEPRGSRKRKGLSPKPHLRGHIEDHTYTDSSYLRASKRHTSAAVRPGIDSLPALVAAGHEVPPVSTLVPEDLAPAETVGKRKHYQNSEPPLLTWIPLRQQYLESCLAQDSRGRHISRCNRCFDDSPSEWVRCETCFGRANYCKSCALLIHAHQPLHNLKVWRNGYWNKLDMRIEGAYVDLGHPPGVGCLITSREVKSFVVIHTDGIHLVHVRFCGCQPNYSELDQLLDIGWWPATTKMPSTAATDEALRLYDKVSARGRVSTYHWCEALLDMYNPNGLLDPPFIYESFKTMQREYRHIKMMKRFGRGHDPSGVDGTQPGELVVHCRACPQPPTIPEDMSLIPLNERWLQTLFLSEDANYRNRGRARSSEEKDPTLLRGTAYVVEHKRYLKVINKLPAPTEASNCSSFNAISLANLKRNKGLRATGIGMVTCSRHDLVRPQAIGDLQVGERYRNMDYIFLSSIAGAKIYRLNHSYDISCQWSVNLWPRISLFPKDLQPNLRPEDCDHMVPKFHHAAHTVACQEQNSFNYQPGVGRTEGEGSERTWSEFNEIAASAKELGPGGRHDLIDIKADSRNFRKLKGYKSLMITRIKNATTNMVLHSRAHRALEAGLRERLPLVLSEWADMVQKWEKDKSQANPYQFRQQFRSMKQVRADLAAQEVADNKSFSSPSKEGEMMSPSAFLWEILCLEKICLMILLNTGDEVDPSIALDIAKKRRILHRRLIKIQPAQAHHMPGLQKWLGNTTKPISASNPEVQKLWPPSAVPESVRNSVCRGDLAIVERKLRESYAFERLEELRTRLRFRTELQRFKRFNLVGQIAHTKSYEAQAQAEKKVQLATKLYQDSYNALLALAGPGDWQRTLRELTSDDVVGLTERLMRDEEKRELELTRHRVGLVEMAPTIPLSTAQLGEGHRTMSWIWRSVSVGEMEGDDTGRLHEDLRVEWAKSRARYLRWHEEVQLVEEEMRRILAYGEWKSKWWLNRLQMPPVALTPIVEGQNAYAREQHDFEVQFRDGLDTAWKELREKAKQAILRQDRLRELEKTQGFQEDDEELDLDDFEYAVGDDEEDGRDEDVLSDADSDGESDEEYNEHES